MHSLYVIAIPYYHTGYRCCHYVLVFIYTAFLFLFFCCCSKIAQI